MYILLSSILLLFVIAHQTMSFSLNKQYNKNSAFTAVNAMLCMVVLDRLIKYWTITEIAPLKKGIELINGVFRFSYVENRGAAFGMLQNHRWVFIVATTVLVIAGLIWLFKCKLTQPFTKSAVIMIAAGGIGNLIDRVFIGYVIDTFDFYLINFAVFNVADCFVCVGAALLIIGILLTPEKKKEKISEDSQA